MWQYSVSKINVYLPRHVDFGDKNKLMDQNFVFAWSTKSKNVGQAHSHVGICKKAQEVQIALCPSEKHMTNFIPEITYSKHAAMLFTFLHQIL